MSTYSDHLLDPRWQKKRLEILERDKFTCQCCGDTKTTLDVHHLRYNGFPWEAEADNIETLCRPCHESRTEFDKYLANLFKSIPTSLARELKGELTRCRDLHHGLYNERTNEGLLFAKLLMVGVGEYFKVNDLSGV